MFAKIFSWIRSVSRKKLYIGIFLILVVVAILFSLGGDNGKEFLTVARGDVVQEVASTGKVKPAEEVELGFDRSGRVSSVYKVVGDTVSKGETIASLEAGEAIGDLEKAKAILREETIKLENIKINSPTTRLLAEEGMLNALRDAFASADDAVRNKADQFFENVPANPRFEVTFEDGNFKHYFSVSTDVAADLNNRRKAIETMFVEWEKELKTINSSNYSNFSTKTASNLELVSAFLDRMASAVNSFAPSDFTYETTVSGYKTSINTARSNITLATTDLVSAREKLKNSPTQIGSGYNDVLEQEAKVAQARAAVSSLESSALKYMIRAPFAGIITKQDAKLGGTVSGGESLVSLISDQKMYIEANISEINVGKLVVGNKVNVTFDAFPGQEFLGTVSFIEPGDVVIDGVVNYKIRVTLDEDNTMIKSGLTANLKIETSKKENVVSVPLYAIKKEGDKSFVEVQRGKDVEKVEVSLGLSGNNGVVEILSGVSEGDTLVY